MDEHLDTDNKGLIQDTTEEYPTLFAMRIGAAFLFIDLAVRLFGIVTWALALLIGTGENPTGYVSLSSVVYLFLDGIGGYILWQGRRDLWGVVLRCAVLPFMSGVCESAVSPSPVLIMYLIGMTALLGSLALILTGKSTPQRMTYAVVLFAAGYGGGVLLSGLIALLGGFLNFQHWPRPY